MVYAASVAAQVMLEMLVHADATILSLSYVLIPARFDDRCVTRLDRSTLAAAWAEDQGVTRRAVTHGSPGHRRPCSPCPAQS